MRNTIVCVICLLVFALGVYVGNITSMRSENFTAFKSGEHISFYVGHDAPHWAENEISRAIMSYSIKK